jgi:hypothetical protein
MATTRSGSARLLGCAGWLQIVLAVVLAVALALTWKVFLNGARDIGTTARETLAAADQALASVETVLQANEPQVLEAQKVLQGYADFSQAVAENTAQTIPLLRDWGKDTDDLGESIARLGNAISAVPFCGPAGKEVTVRGTRLRETGAKMKGTAAALERDALPAVRRTTDMLKRLSDGSMEVSSRDLLAATARARRAVQESMGTVAPAMTLARLTCGVYAALALVLLLCGATMVLLGRALAAEGRESACSARISSSTKLT